MAGGIGKHVNGIAGVALGAAAGVATYAFTDASLSEAGEVSVEFAVPYGEVGTELAAGNTQGAVKAGMTETAGIVGAVATGMAVGAAVGSIVPVAGTAVGAVVGAGAAIVGGVGAGMATDYVLTEVPEIVDAVHDGLAATMDAVGIGSDTVKEKYNQTLETAGDLKNKAYDVASGAWGGIRSYFNGEAAPETAVAEAGPGLSAEQAREALLHVDPGDPALQGHPEVASLVQVAKNEELFNRQFSELQEHDGVGVVSDYMEENPALREEKEVQVAVQNAPDLTQQAQKKTDYDGMSMA